jgi:uncharacterized membrane protein HdeD (DUF308 family)
MAGIASPRQARTIGGSFARSWKLLAWRGGLGITFGLAVFLWPRMTLPALVLAFGAYTLVDGIVAVSLGARPGVTEQSWAILLEGVAGVGLALGIFLWTRVAVELVALLIGFWAIATGLLQLVVAIRLRREMPTEPLLVVAGLASLLLGFAVFLWPMAAGPFAFAALLASYTLVFGAAMLLQGLRVRKVLRRLGGVPRAHAV